MTDWKDCRRLLCIRPDNMGDVLMSSPAIRALKESFGCRITLLTSSAASHIASFIPEIDETIVWDVSWVKRAEHTADKSFFEMIDWIRSHAFDGAVIFTVFSQNPLPSVMLAALAGIPLRLAYCRENPYDLLTHWVPDEEPYQFIRHQVRRDLDLVKTIGALADHERIVIRQTDSADLRVLAKLSDNGVNTDKPWIMMHPGVSEAKREYPVVDWIEAGKKIIADLGYQIVLTGNSKEAGLTTAIKTGIGVGAHSFAGIFTVEELIACIQRTPLLISVNTGPAHLAAATQTPVIVLYALTNPQHAPWKTTGAILPYSPPANLESRNEVLRFVKRKFFGTEKCVVKPDDIVRSAYDILIAKKNKPIPELVSVASAYPRSGDQEHLELPGSIELPKD